MMASLIGLVVLICFSISLVGSTQLPTATITKVYRNAEYLEGKSKAWTPATAGTNLQKDDSLKTLNNSYADLQLDPPNRFRLKENTVLKIEQLQKEAKEPDGSVVKLTELGLLKGEVLARLDKLPANVRLSLRSPVAIAAVRGTTFAIGVRGDAKTTWVAVSEDRVRVQSAGEPGKYVNLDAQQQTTVSPWDVAFLSATGTGLPPKKMLIERLSDPKVSIKDTKKLLERLEKPKPSLKEIIIGADAKAATPTDDKDAGEAERLAMEKARDKARKQIIDKLRMIRLSEEETIGDLMDGDAKTCEAILTYTLKAKTVKAEYDKSERYATVRLDLPLEPVVGIIKRDISFAWKDIQPISQVEYAAAFGGFIRIATERAAEVDAYRRLAEKIYGTVIDSETTLKNFAVKNDQVKVAVKGIVRGAEEVSKIYYSDGSIDVVLRIDGDVVKGTVAPIAGDIFGKNYMASPAAISAEDFIDLLKADQL